MNSLTELIAVKSAASVGNCANTNFLNVPSGNLIELLASLKLVIVLIFVFNLSTEFLRYPKLGIVSLELVPSLFCMLTVTESLLEVIA